MAKLEFIFTKTRKCVFKIHINTKKKQNKTPRVTVYFFQQKCFPSFTSQIQGNHFYLKVNRNTVHVIITLNHLGLAT